MPQDFIPAKLQDLLSWSANFNTKITASPTTYGLTAGQATAYAALHTAFAAALLASTTPATRTSVTVAATETARNNLVFTARQYARIVQGTPGMSAANLETLGLTVRQTVPTPIPAPTTKPIVTIDRVLSQQFSCRFADESTPTSRSKPFGATQLEVRASASSTPIVSAEDAAFKGLASRVPFTIDFAGADIGKTAYVFARWVTAKGLTGPWSTVTTGTVAA